MAIINAITNAGVLGIDGALEPERRLQELLRVWLGKYFSGVAFATRTVAGGSENKTFQACGFLWQEDAMPESPGGPLIHVFFPNAGVERLDLSPGVFGHGDRWLLDILIKVPGTLSGTTLTPANPEHLARKVADQVLWLLGSSEREALSACGVEELKVERAPVPLPGGTWHTRMLLASCLTRREQSR